MLLKVCRREFAEYMSGSRLLPGSQPAAHCYAGHQFGHFSGQLGDGAATYLGEVSEGSSGIPLAEGRRQCARRSTYLRANPAK